MRLLFAGTPDVAVPTLQALLDSEHEVAAVLTRPDARTGRGRRTAPSPVRVVAEQAGIPVLTPLSLRDAETQQAVREVGAEVAVVVAYGNLVPPVLLDLPRHGWLNLHFSLLPAWRGAAPVQRAVIAGDETSGASVFRLEQGLDTGPVFAQLREPIAPTDTSGALLERLAERGAGLLVQVLAGLADGSAVATAQPEQGVSLAPKLGVDDARIDWSAPAATVDRLIRGCTPAPGAWTSFRGERVRVDPATVGEAVGVGDAVGVQELAPGELSVTNKRVLVGTGQGVLRLGGLRAAGKKPMPAPDWARGVRPQPGERFA